MNRTGFMFCLAALTASATLHAQAPTAAPFITHKLKPDVYWVEGGGGNSGVIIGDKGVIVIDAKTTAAGGKELIDSIAKITPISVTTVLLTHSDGDHVNGLASFPSDLMIVAHENTRKELQTALSGGGRGAPPADRLPTQVVAGTKENLRVNGFNFELLHWAPAHTSGDLIVYLPGSGIVFTGDIVATNRPDPLIHLEKNGSSEGWIETMKGIIALNAETYIPGHGDAQTKAQLESRLARAEAKRAKIKDLIAQGKSLEDIKTAVGDPAPVPGRGGPNFASFTDVVYKELAKK